MKKPIITANSKLKNCNQSQKKSISMSITLLPLEDPLYPHFTI